jgi:hypothetical protein
MFQDGLDDLPLFDKVDDPNSFQTHRTDRGIDLVDSLDQVSPVFSGIPSLLKIICQGNLLQHVRTGRDPNFMQTTRADYRNAMLIQ